ncbi:MAG: Tetraacyldisaccharide 4'-kinase [Syntrophorhabdus sp. PtaU1.Bin058]|nr:MAG: Tetraacyldisaccharide 4'-kinase [Syntrophorhabdus sp. PtaU1.Bin058]
MRDTIVKMWRGEAETLRFILYIPLLLLSVLYRFCLALREYAYGKGILKTEKAGIPVISVGNITLGGTGKTPIVDSIARRLKDRGFNPGIITRGYMRKRQGTFYVDVRNDTAEDVGDEAMMLARRSQIPIMVGANRILAIDKGIEMFNIDTAILDDGFQLKNIMKDMDILVLNGEKGLTGHDLFPLGPYRERAGRIEEADIILVNKGELDDHTRHYAGRIPAFHVTYKPVYLCNMKDNLMTHYNFLMGKRILAFSGLGDNRSFFNLLSNLGAKVVHTISYPDHHVYTERDIEQCASFQDVQCMVTTEKDAVKLVRMELPENLFYLSIDVFIEGEEDLLGLITDRIDSYRNELTKTDSRTAV